MYTVAVDLFVNCCGQQADSVTVFVTDKNTPYSGCGDMSISSNPTTLVFQCTPPKTGKYIVVEFVSHSSLRLATPRCPLSVRGYHALYCALVFYFDM